MTDKRIDLVDILRQRFFSALHLGMLKPGARLPSIRDIEAEFGVDRRAVMRAYRTLEREGVVELRQRSGVYFGAKAIGLPGLAPPEEWAVEMFVRGLEMGIPVPSLGDRMNAYISRRPLRALCVECNTDQISALVAEIETDYGIDGIGAEVDELLAEREPRDDLKSADVVITTQFHAGEVQQLAASVQRPWITVSQRTNVYAEIARLLPTTEMFFIVEDPRYAAKLETIFAPVDSRRNFRSIVISTDDVQSIPDTAPVYISRAARKRLDNAALLERVMPEERTFSLASAREILTLVVGSNIAETDRSS